MQKAKATRISESSSFISLHLNAETSACSLYTDGEFHAIGVSLFFIFFKYPNTAPDASTLVYQFLTIFDLFPLFYYFFSCTVLKWHITQRSKVSTGCVHLLAWRAKTTAAIKIHPFSIWCNIIRYTLRLWSLRATRPCRAAVCLSVSESGDKAKSLVAVKTTCVTILHLVWSKKKKRKQGCFITIQSSYSSQSRWWLRSSIKP